MLIVGHCLVKNKVSKTKFLFGTNSEIEGQLLPVLEKNSSGDCLCIIHNKGLVDVDNTDIVSYIPSIKKDIFNIIIQKGM